MAIEFDGGSPMPSEEAGTIAEEALTTVAPTIEAVDTPPIDTTSAPVVKRSFGDRVNAAATQLRSRPTTGSVVEPVSPHVVPHGGGTDVPGTETGHGGEGHIPSFAFTQVRVVLSAIAGFVGSLFIMGTSPVWRLAPPAWRATVPGLEHPGSSFYSGVMFVIGLALMAAAWVGLVGRARRPVGSERSRVKIVVAVAVLWSLPMLISPVQLSTDAYSYAAQGYMATLGIDPSATGPNALRHGNNEFWIAADPVWRDVPAPYGPVAVTLEKVNVTLTGYDVSHAVWGFRFLAVVGVIMTGFGVWVIARARGISQSLALALAIANPLVIIHLVGGSHNDSLMMGLLVLGMAANDTARAAGRRRPSPPARAPGFVGRLRSMLRSIVWSVRYSETGHKVLAIALVSCAVAVKLPAILGLVFLAWNWKGVNATFKQRVLSAPVVVVASAVFITVMCGLAGIGGGWITALKGTGKIYSTYSVFTQFGFLISDVLRAVGLNLDPLDVVGVSRLVGLFISGVVALILMFRSPKIGVTKSVGLALLAVVLLGPVIWPWYLPAGIALVAAAGVNRFRPSMMVLVISASALVFPTSVSAIEGLAPYQHWLGFGVAVLVALACVVTQFISRYLEQRRARLGLDPFVADRVLETASA